MSRKGVFHQRQQPQTFHFKITTNNPADAQMVEYCNSKADANYRQLAPSIAVVVIGRNEGGRLTRCLASVREMDLAGIPIELIYVDSASTDDSVKRAKAFGAKVISIAPDRPCAAKARNAGWRAALASMVLFLDGDTVLAADFFCNAHAHFDDPHVGVVFGHRREINPGGSIYNRVLDLDWIMRSGEVEFCGGDALMRRDMLRLVQGYDERLIAGEDAELCSRIRAKGYKVICLERDMVGHDLAMTRFGQYWRRAIRTGYAYAEVSEIFKPEDSPIWYRETRRNRLKGALVASIVVGSPAASVLLWSPAPALLGIVILALLSIRTAFRTRWKRVGFPTRLLHGLHSHLVQIPILFGQLTYFKNKLTGQIGPLLEYK